jgi:hypothetical protein
LKKFKKENKSPQLVELVRENLLGGIKQRAGIYNKLNPSPNMQYHVNDKYALLGDLLYYHCGAKPFNIRTMVEEKR